MTTISPCLWFDDNGLEAAELYVSVIPNSRITNISYYGPDQPGKEGTAMTVAFELAGRPFTALNGGPQFKFTEAISLQVSAADQEEVDRYTDQLTAGGGEVGPCGWVKDRFGLSWQVVPDALPQLFSDPNPLRANAAVQAMLKMTKIDIQALRDAADAAAPAPAPA
jgi:predicted 3-demethylubiquinone-9 3-methyltransferase (glyoxalase superfamily)